MRGWLDRYYGCLQNRPVIAVLVSYGLAVVFAFVVWGIVHLLF